MNPQRIFSRVKKLILILFTRIPISVCQCVGASATDNGASQSPSVLNGGSGLPVKNSAAGPVPRESGSSEASDVEGVDGPRRKPQHGKS